MSLQRQLLSPHDFKIEGRTPDGPISFAPYRSRAAAEADLPRVKRLARGFRVIRDSWRILPIHERSALSAEEHAALAAARAYLGRLWKMWLRRAWDRGSYIALPEDVMSTLRRLREAPYFGSAGLAAYKRPGDAQFGPDAADAMRSPR